MGSTRWWRIWRTYPLIRRCSPSWRGEAGRTATSESWRERISCARSRGRKRSLGGCRSSGARSPCLQYVSELTRQIARTDGAGGLIDIVRHANEVNPGRGRLDREQSVASAPISILRSAYAASVDELNSIDDALPRLVGVAEADDIPGARTEVAGHLFQK